MSIFKNIRAMHAKYGFEPRETPGLLSKKQMDFRVDFIEEEFDELIRANLRNDLPETIDALIDIMVVCAGTLDLMGCDGQAHWNEVHWANMKKEVATADNPSKRGAKELDLVKPEGWEPPDHVRIIND